MILDLNHNQSNSEEIEFKSLADIAMGIFYYRKFLLLWVLVLLLLCLEFIMGIFEDFLFSNSYFSGILILSTIILFIIYDISYLCKSMSLFCKIPDYIYPYAKPTIIKSWLTLILCCVIFFVIYSIYLCNESTHYNAQHSSQSYLDDILQSYNINTTPRVNNNQPDNTILDIFTTSLHTDNELIAIGTIILWIISISLLLYSFGSFAIFVYQLKLTFVPGSTIGRIGLSFIFYYHITIFYLINKLYQFFSTQFNYKELKRNYSSTSKFSFLFITLFVISSIGLIKALIPGIQPINTSIYNDLTYAERKTIQEYARIEKSILKDETFIINQYINNKISDKQFEKWLTKSSLPKWEHLAEILSNSNLDSPTIKEMESINNDRIEYCKLFIEALKLQTEESFNKALQKYVHTDLRVFIFTSKDKTISKEAIQDGLYKAIYVNDEEMVKWFINKGADVNQANPDGKKPVQLAREYHYTNIVILLQYFGANDFSQNDYNVGPIELEPIETNSPTETDLE